MFVSIRAKIYAMLYLRKAEFNDIDEIFKLLQLSLPDDRKLIRKYLYKSAELLFLAGATEMYLPYTGVKVVRNLDEAKKLISSTAFFKIIISTVHLMSSIPAIPGSREISTRGFLKKCTRVRVLDASILPTTIGESPQGTIMAFTKFLLKLSRH
jgi:hypothetical protein